MTPPRRPCRFRRHSDLVERLAPYVQPIDREPEPLVSVEPLRWWLEGWIAATGDRPEVVARGFGLKPDLVCDLLAARINLVGPSEAAELRHRLGLDRDGLGPLS